jgi:hypothetical protein
MSLQWALPMLPQVLPDDLMSKIQSAAVDPFYICDSATSMPVYNGETGEKIKVSLHSAFRICRQGSQDQRMFLSSNSSVCPEIR